MTAKLTGMTNMIDGAFITRNSIGADKLGQSLMAEMIEMTVPKGGRGRDGRVGGSARCW
jgi:hypothetical protein